MSLFILGVEEPSRNHNKIAHDAVFRVYAEDDDVPFFPSSDGDTVVQSDHGRGSYDARHFLLRRPHVIHGQRIRCGVIDALPSTWVFGVNHVGADGLDLVNHILLASHADGDYQDQRSCADNHAEGSQRESYFVAAKCIVGEVEDLADGHVGSQTRTRRSADRHTALDAKRWLAEAQ